jgi:alkanesulfonate monooxygenase SsuD/methylene tetrahydromethanopterin reductase-like flavin-dependent oxidoreductase (luciferase family)
VRFTLPLHHPVHVAEDCAVIRSRNQRAPGIGVWCRLSAHDFDAFEVPVAERATRTEEALEVMRKAWTGKRFSYDGKHFHYKDTLITPTPFQKPGPPIWMASWTPPGLRRAAKMTDGWIADPVQSLPVIKDYADRYRTACQKAGRKPYICLMRDAVVADSMKDAETQSNPTMYTHRFYFQYGAYVPDEHLKDVKRPEDLTFKQCAKERLIVGSPEDCLQQLQMWKEDHPP